MADVAVAQVRPGRDLSIRLQSEWWRVECEAAKGRIQRGSDQVGTSGWRWLRGSGPGVFLPPAHPVNCESGPGFSSPAHPSSVLS